MNIRITDLSKNIGYNYLNVAKPFYLLNDVDVFFSFSGEMYNTWTIRVLKSFTSDGCTLWKIFWLLLGCPHKPEYIPASIIHDWMVEHPETVGYNRNLSSRIFEALLLRTGVKPIKARIMYLAVEFWQSLTNLWRKKWKY